MEGSATFTIVPSRISMNVIARMTTSAAAVCPRGTSLTNPTGFSSSICIAFHNMTIHNE